MRQVSKIYLFHNIEGEKMNNLVEMEMKKLFKVKGKVFYWAGSRFLYRGLWMWNGKENIRIIALNRFRNWNGKSKKGKQL